MNIFNNIFFIKVLKFLQKAALSLREPYYLKAPSIKLSGKDRAAIVAKVTSFSILYT